MQHTNSPWIHQLKRTRPLTQLSGNIYTQVAIIGGGIAGVTSAYYTLKNTNKNVLLVEGHKIAHGATGHNAGQLVSYFEKSFSELVSGFGLRMAAEGQTAIESVWLLIEELFADTGLKTPFYQFTGYAGCKDFDEVLVHLEDNMMRVQGGLTVEQFYIAKEAPFYSKIPAKYRPYFNTLPQKDILNLLETSDTSYYATLSSRKGCMNSALFTEQLIEHLLKRFGHRFTVLEHTLIKKLELNKHHADLITDTFTITADQVVLCTNGFERITIDNKVGKDIDKKFHHLVRGSVGYMAGYLTALDKPPVAISYLPNRKSTSAFNADPYFYVTRRPYELEENEHHNLICIGGPEALMDDTNNYHREHPYSDEALQAIDSFLHTTYKDLPEKINYKFAWHGLMGYTPNGVRCVGFEPRNPILLYNLGCNGVGILPSIFGSERIGQLLSGKKLPPSIFDPRDI